MSRMSNLLLPITRTVTVVVSGTPVQGPDVVIPEGVKVTVKGHPSNTGTMTIADSSANAVNTGANCDRLLANQAQDHQVINMNRIWVDATVSGERVLLVSDL